MAVRDVLNKAGVTILENKIGQQSDAEPIGAAAATHCQIALAREGCPSGPAKPLVFDDDWEHADTNEARCARRALEYSDWCSSTAPVVARYFEGTRVKREERAQRPTRCEISFTEERCPAVPAEMRMHWNDNEERSHADAARPGVESLLRIHAPRDRQIFFGRGGDR